jgi:hypothetical protein
VDDVDVGRVDSKEEVLVLISEFEESSHIYSLDKDENLVNTRQPSESIRWSPFTLPPASLLS